MNREQFKSKMEALINSKENLTRTEKFLEGIKNSEVYLYGAGNAGAMTHQLLEKMDISVRGFIDKNSDEEKLYKNVKVLSPDNVKKYLTDKTYIIVSFLCDYNELKKFYKFLKELGVTNFCYFHDIYNLAIFTPYLINSKVKIEESREIFNESIQNQILKIADWLEDEESQSVYYNFFNGIINSDSSLFSVPNNAIQYFVEDIKFSKSYQRFIDCGAYDGDTALMLKKLKGKVEKVAYFEPEIKNFNKLVINTQNQEIADEEIYFPCGVWNKADVLKFNSGIQSSSSISEEGIAHIQCLSIDEALRGFCPTFIKMDIEGAEYKALLGAEKNIRAYTPDLAISIYHKIEDMWEIPYLIKQINPKYKFYLRCHGLHGMETILYATEAKL
ncbi:FkbM family methyltransferase [Fusibacter sp. 3D3]|uniref:FkbM family methyltransferase n=1 Tax=Fusibacter sp. 3D3 TaxID=1048380 RepID=UPI0008537E91|nr:FkbM family methyltransferase [Fusibacter sp. 3D3]GAU75656.1 methyltransferase FkbM family [Fusibacter sp. 3D3]